MERPPRRLPFTYRNPIEIESLASRIVFIHQKADGGKTHHVGPLLGCSKKTSFNSLMTIFWQDGERVKTYFPCLCLFVHSGKIFSNMLLCGFEKRLPQFMKKAVVVACVPTTLLLPKATKVFR